MRIETRPSLFHWIIAVTVVLVVAAIAWIPILFAVARFFPVEQRLLVSCTAAFFVALLLFPLAVRSGRTARWSVDLEGIASPAIGRISFSEIVTLHLGFPRPESLPMRAFQSVVARGSRPVFDQTLVLHLSDGRLLPLNLLSPSIHDGRKVMSKIAEFLAAKELPNTPFSKAEIAVLRSRPLNRIVIPKNE